MELGCDSDDCMQCGPLFVVQIKPALVIVSVLRDDEVNSLARMIC